MSILETDTIDIIATKPGSRIVKLVVADHLDWSDPDGHCQLLQKKIHAYIVFFTSGQLERTTAPSVPTDPEVIIAVAAAHEPNAAGIAFLTRMKAFVTAIDIGFVVEIRTRQGRLRDLDLPS